MGISRIKGARRDISISDSSETQREPYFQETFPRKISIWHACPLFFDLSRGYRHQPPSLSSAIVVRRDRETLPRVDHASLLNGLSFVV